MGLFDLFKKKPRQDLKYIEMLNGHTPIFSQFGNDIYASDVVLQAMNCIVREMRKLDPQHIIKKGADVTPIYDEVQRTLDNPNPLMTTGDFIEKITWQLFSTYNVFICPTWDHNGKLDGLYPLHPVQVDFLQDTRGTIFLRMWFANDYRCEVLYSDLIHIRYNYSSDELMGGNEYGQPDHKALLKTLELNETMLDGVGKALRSSFAINGIVKYNTMLDEGKTEKAIKELGDALRRNESGLMPMDMKADFIPFSRDIAMVDSTTLEFIDSKILRHFGVSIPILTGDYTKEQYEAFYQKTLEPLIKSFSQAFTKTLFSSRESNGYGHRIMFYPKDLIFLNTTQKLEMIRLLGDSGALYENEKRVMMGLKPLPELEGVRKASLNYVNADIADEYQLDAKQDEEEEPPEEEPTEEEPQEVEEDDEEEVQSE